MTIFRGLLAALPALALVACASQPETRYREAYQSGDTRYGDYYYADEYDDYGPGHPYYAALWPAYGWVPYPGYYYGVTYFPSLRYGLGGYGAYDWPHYTAYSPYLLSPWDAYYHWSQPSLYRSRASRPTPAAGAPRYGSALNQAERVARMLGADRAGPSPTARALEPSRSASLTRTPGDVASPRRLDMRADGAATPRANRGRDALDVDYAPRRGIARRESGWIAPAPGSAGRADPRMLESESRGTDTDDLPAQDAASGLVESGYATPRTANARAANPMEPDLRARYPGRDPEVRARIEQQPAITTDAGGARFQAEALGRQVQAAPMARSRDDSPMRREPLRAPAERAWRDDSARSTLAERPRMESPRAESRGERSRDRDRP